MDDKKNVQPSQSIFSFVRAFGVLITLAAHVPFVHAEQTATSCIVESLQEASFQEKYHFADDTKRPLTFSYEIEIHPLESPAILNYYKLPQFTDDEWMALPLVERLSLSMERQSKGRRKTAILKKLLGAPDFLSDDLTIEAGGRVEASRNEITSSLSTVAKHLEWFWKNIGPGSVQGHVVFRPQKGFRNLTDPIANYIKIDSDIAQTEALTKGYQAYLEKGRIPGKNLSNASLGPYDRATVEKLQSRLRSPLSRSSATLDDQSKLVYGVAFRPDLYGSGKVGFEIRNCHNRLPCIIEAMKSLAAEAADSFKPYRHLSDTIAINEADFKSLPKDIRSTFDEAAAFLIQRDRINNLARGAAPYEHRFMLPLLNWKDHVLLKNGLSRTAYRAFVKANEEAVAEYLNTVRKLAQSKVSGADLVTQLQIAVSKWAHDSGISEQLKTAKTAVIAHQRWSGAAPAAVLAGNRPLMRELKPRTYSQLITSESPEGIVKALNGLSPQNRTWLTALTNLKGLKTSATTPAGGVLQRVILNTSPSTLDTFITVARNSNMKPELRALLTIPFNNGIPDRFNNIDSAKDILSIFSPAPSLESKSRLVNTFKKGISEKNRNHYLFDQLLLAHLADTVTPLSRQKFMIKTGEQWQLARFNDRSKTIRLTSIKEQDLSPLSKRAQKFETLSLSKSKVRTGDFNLLQLIKNDPKAVFLISAKNIHHQGLVIGNQVYSVISNSGVTKLPLSSWVNRWGNSVIIKLKADPTQKEQIFKYMESQLGVPVNFAIQAKPGHVNCTNMISDALKKAGIMEMPNEYVRSSSKGQLQYFVQNAKQLDQVEGIFVRNTNGIDPALGLKWVMAGIYAIPASILIDDGWDALTSADIGVGAIDGLYRGYNSGGKKVLIPAVEVYYVQKDSPAAEAGIHLGDQIVTIDGKRLSSKAPWHDYQARINGFPGTKVKVGFYDNGVYHEVEITRGFY